MAVSLRKQYTVYAVDSISFDLRQGRPLAWWGAGCAQVHPGAFVAQAVRAERRLHHPRGRDITHLSPKEMRSLRQEMQIVFQDPAESSTAATRLGRS